DQTGPLVAADQEPEEEAGLLAGQGQVPELVQDEDPGIGELLQGPVEPVLVAGPDEAPHQALEGQEEDRVAGLDGLDAEGDGEVRLAHAGRAEQHDVLGALDEAEAGELADLLAVDRGLKAEAKLTRLLAPRRRGRLRPALDPRWCRPRHSASRAWVRKPL